MRTCRMNTAAGGEASQRRSDVYDHKMSASHFYGADGGVVGTGGRGGGGGGGGARRSVLHSYTHTGGGAGRNRKTGRQGRRHTARQ